MATIESTWDLRSNSSPRSLCAYPAPTPPTSAGASSDAGGRRGGGSSAGVRSPVPGNNPFDQAASNPFDAATSPTLRSPLTPDATGGGGGAAAGATTGSSSAPYAVVFGTERGALHYRTYVRPADAPSSTGTLGSPEKKMVLPMGGRRVEQPLGAGGALIGSSGGSGGGGVSSLHKPVDLTGAVPGAVVGVIRATTASAQPAAKSFAPSTNADASIVSPTFLLLVDDNRGTSSSSSANPGAYAAHLVTLKHGTFSKLPPAASVPASALGMAGPSFLSGGGGAAASGGAGSGADGAGAASGVASSSSSSTTSSLPPLPRASCASYHPASGYVVAAGSSVYSLHPSAVLAVGSSLAEGMMAGPELPLTAGMGMGGGIGIGSSSGGLSRGISGMSVSMMRHATSESTTTAQFQQAQMAAAARAKTLSSLLPTVKFEARNVLPNPGARSGPDAMCLACNGRVAVVGVGNSFWAVSGTLVGGGYYYVPAPGMGGAGGGGAGGAGGAGGHGGHHHPDEGAGYAHDDHGHHGGGHQHRNHPRPTEVLTFTQSGRVHPAIAIEVPVPTTKPTQERDDLSGFNSARHQQPPSVATSLLFLASGRECAAVEILHDPRFAPGSSGGTGAGGVGGSSDGPGPVAAGPARNGVATLASPILAAVGLMPPGGATAAVQHGGGPLVAVLTSDGLLHVRSPSCVGVPLSTIEVGARPNDFFTLRALPGRRLVAASYGGEGRLIGVRMDTAQDQADRLMKLAIDAFGTLRFPRTELAEAVSASFTATSYVGPEPTPQAKILLRQYLEAVLGLSDGFGGDMAVWGGYDDGESGEGSASSKGTVGQFRAFDPDEGGPSATSSSSSSPAAFLSGTALLCLVCSQLSPPNPSLANRAARSCSSKMGPGERRGSRINASSVKVCELIANDLLGLDASSSDSPKSGGMDAFVEASIWLLRSAGMHSRAIDVLVGKMNDHAGRNRTPGGSSGTAGSAGHTATGAGAGVGGWSQLKFESFLSTHLSELWSSGDDSLADLVLTSPATVQLLTRNPKAGLGVFTSNHPQNAKQWRELLATDDPLVHPTNVARVVELLKSVQPAVPYDGDAAIATSSAVSAAGGGTEEGSAPLPLTSGRALAVTYLESAVGISTGRPVPHGLDDGAFEALPPDEGFEERASDLHDEVSYLLLEGVIAERGDDDDQGSIGESKNEHEEDTELGMLYRSKLRRFLSWPNAKVRSERLLQSIPPAFLREQALLLGRLGRHDDALRILYCDLKSLDLALEYCDARYERSRVRLEQEKKASAEARNVGGGDSAAGTARAQGCSYLPLVRVALESDPEGSPDRGTAAAIQVLALRRSKMDRAAALRLLPQNLPLTALARPFLIPALVDGESEVRRLTVAASLLRARYVQLKRSLTEAQIASQASLYSVPALRSLKLGELIRSSKPFRARPVHATSSSFPDVTIIKHYFPRYLVIQAKITNSAISAVNGEGRTLGDVAFVVAESSDENLLPTVRVPLRTLPPKSTGSVWCALAASPQRLDGVAIMTCELRYTVLAVDAATGAPLSFGGGGATVGLGRSYVEELQDIEVRHTDFE